MKKLLAVALAMFAIYMSYVFVGGFVQSQQPASTETSATPSSSSQVVASPTAAADTFTVDQVAQHNTTDDCWLIINQKVYSVGPYLGEHPGGAATIIPYCGMEATQAFDTQDRGSGGGHSSWASQLLGDYLIGSIASN